MKILFLAPYPPYPPHGGGQQRMYHFIRQAAHDHEVWLLTFSPSADATAALAPLHDLCHVVTVPTPQHTIPRRLRTLLLSPLPDMALRGQSPAFQAALHRLLHEIPFDVIQAESIEMAQYGAQHAGGPLSVYDAFNAEFLLQRRACLTDLRRLRAWPVAAYSLIQWRKLKRYESRLGRHFAGVFAVSPDDVRIIGSLAPDLRVGIVPNGVDTTYFQPNRSAVSTNSPYVLFTGTLDFRANIDAITWFTCEVFPLVQADQPDVRFVVVGRNPGAAVQALADQRSVEIVGEVADVRPWFDGAAAYVVPMRIGGGVRLKLLEAFAMEQAVVATHMGAEGVAGLEDGTHALLADQPAAFAAHLRTILRDPAVGRRLGANGRALVAARYDWRMIVPQMVALWEAWRAV